MIIKNSKALQKWIACRIENICYGDPHTISKYILALIKKDEKENELYKICLDQLEVFLSEGTEHFVDLLFDTLKTKSYLFQVKRSNRKSLFMKCATENLALKNVEKTSVGEGYENLTSDLRKALKEDEIKCNEESEKCLYVKDENNEGSDKQQIFKISDSREIENITLLKEKEGEWKYDVSDYHTFPVARERTHHNKSIIKEIIQKCQDHHEKGYCMQGNLCKLDHGIHPIVTEDLSIVNFEISGMPNGKKRKELAYNPFEVKPKRVNLESTNALEVFKKKDVKNFSSSVDYVSNFRQSRNFQISNRQLGLHKKEQKLLNSLIQHEKYLLSEFDKAKSEKSKNFLKKAILDVAKKITPLEADVKESFKELMIFYKSYKIPESMFKDKKELLDAEMDLYNKQQKGEDTDELLSKVNNLKQKIKDFSLMIPSSPVTDSLNKKPGFDQFYHTYQIKSLKDSNPFVSFKSNNNSIVNGISNFPSKDACEENLMEKIIDYDDHYKEDIEPRF